MSDVILFPKPQAATKAKRTRRAKPMTLFIHVRRATMIAHIADRHAVAAGAGERARKS